MIFTSSVSAPHPAETTIVAGVDTDGTLAPEQPLAGDVPTNESQAIWNVAQVLPQAEAMSVVARPSDVERETPTVPVRQSRQNGVRQAARALVAAWDASAS